MLFGLGRQVQDCCRPSEQQSGQVMMEFILTMLILLTMVFYFLMLAWALAWGHYVQYATFMSARAYFASTQSPEGQLENARSVLEKMVRSQNGGDLLGFVAKTRDGGDRDISAGSEPIAGAFIGMHPAAAGGQTSRAYSWAHGVQYNFKFKMFILPLSNIFTSDIEGENINLGEDKEGASLSYDGLMPMTADAWLGREDTVSECDAFITDLSFNQGINRRDGTLFVYDNGC